MKSIIEKRIEELKMEQKYRPQEVIEIWEKGIQELIYLQKKILNLKQECFISPHVDKKECNICWDIKVKNQLIEKIAGEIFDD